MKTGLAIFISGNGAGRQLRAVVRMNGDSTAIVRAFSPRFEL